MIKNLIFDFGKVLVDYDFMPIVSSFFTDEAHKQDFCQKIVTPYWIDRMDKGELPFWDIIKEMQQQYPEFHDEIQLFGEHYVDFVTNEVPGMRDLLAKLKSQGYKLYGLTNWSSPVYDVMKRFPEIFSLLDDRIISSEEVLIKPDVAIYKRLCEKFQLKPEECLFTDDKQVNIEGARKAGLHATLFQNADKYNTEISVYHLLDQLNIKYDIITHNAAFSMEECAEVEKTLGAPICKNLFLCNRQQTQFYLLMLPGDKVFKTKFLSSQLGCARLSFASEDHMMELLHIHPGAVSPMGLMNDTENKVLLVIDKDLLQSEYFGCHPCVNTASLMLRLNDLIDKFLPKTGHEYKVVNL